ncbi:MAG: 3-phosphoglycerate dehydrogenase family protein [Desulfobulbaceae bacterium]|nr:3-phosphoglycerate dehydrogenase family protein [Desulfobulbaceae bacterium]
MQNFRIQVLNRIAPEGLALFGEKYRIDTQIENPDALIVRSAQLDTADYPSILAVARAGAGVNNITVSKATEAGICVFNTPGANANAVAELVFVMLGIAARKIMGSIEFVRGLAGLDNKELSRQVEERKAAFKGFELAGKTLGVLGLGKIGIRVANGGIERQMRVLGFDPYPALENIHQLSPEVEYIKNRLEVVRQANVLSVHMPFSEKTKHLVNAELIRQLPKGAILVNYARGAIVDEQAVLAALDSGQLEHYLTDFPSAELLAHPKVFTTPHLGASTEESEEHCAMMAVTELKSFLEYGNVSHSVNFPTAESIPADNVHTRLTMVNRDVPGMIGLASRIIGAHNINIQSYLNESTGVIGYNIIDLESPIPGKVLDEMRAQPGVIRLRTIRM